jgi:MoaA/NifB/PqqE/SkfB family radical SAM enzyme
MHATLPLLQTTHFPAIARQHLSTLQVNLGYKCNQSCVHCHVDAGPHRTEMMEDDLLGMISQVLTARKIETLDLTGGAPELHEGFKRIVTEARALGVQLDDTV